MTYGEKISATMRNKIYNHKGNYYFRREQYSIIRRWFEGETLTAIGHTNNISREAVRQIITLQVNNLMITPNSEHFISYLEFLNKKRWRTKLC
jgi:DNA-directed RNA polymerase sigma subunit (sigma70/sigma32)